MTQEYQDSSWRQLDGPLSRTGYIQVPLASIRKVTANDILVTATTDAGVLSKDTAPILEYTATSTDGSLRIRYAAAGVSGIAFQAAMPSDCDPSSPVLIKFFAAMGGATDIPTLSTASYFNVGGTKRTNVTGAVTGTTAATYTATIAASQVPSNPVTLSCEVTPAAHGTDTLNIYAVWVEYTKK